MVRRIGLLAMVAVMPFGASAWLQQPKPLAQRTLSQRLAKSSITSSTSSTLRIEPASFLTENFAFSACDNSNTPPSLAVILRSIQYLFQKNKSDLRGRYVPHATHGSLLGVAHVLKQASIQDDQPLLTPFIAYCIGCAIGQEGQHLAIGRDPRTHGTALADALARGASAAGMHVVDLGIATTPACAAYTKLHHGSIAVVGTTWIIGLKGNSRLFEQDGDCQSLASRSQWVQIIWNEGFSRLA